MLQKNMLLSKRLLVPSDWTVSTLFEVIPTSNPWLPRSCSSFRSSMVVQIANDLCPQCHENRIFLHSLRGLTLTGQPFP